MAVATGTAMLAAGALSAGASAYGASQSGKAAGRATDAQKQAAMQDLAFRQEQYNRYLGLMGPIEERLAREAQSTQPLDYEQNTAAIRQNYANALRNISSSMGLRGMAGSGLDVGAMRGAAFTQAGDLSGAYAQGLQNRRKLGLDLTGRGQIGQAAQGVQGGLQGMANYYGQQAGMYNQAASQGWQNFGQGLTGLANMYGQMQQPTPQAQYGGPTASNIAGGQTGAFGTGGAWASTVPLGTWR